jgi:hypothetical protein
MSVSVVAPPRFEPTVASTLIAMDRGGHHVTRELFEQNLTAKLDDLCFGVQILDAD